MTWLQRYRLREFVRFSFWLAPVTGVVVAIIMSRLLRWSDSVTGWKWFNFTPVGARAILGAFVSSMLTFVVFVCSTLLLVVQLASAQLTPRIIAPAIRNSLVRVSISATLFSYTFSLTLLGRIGDVVPQFSVLMACLFNLISFVTFLYFIGKAGITLRPVAILTLVGSVGRKVIDEIYPLDHDARSLALPPRPAPALGEATCVITHTGASRVLLAFDAAGLVELARQNACVIELIPRVGDFVATGDAMLNIYGGTSPPERLLRHSLAFGPERTLEQDPAFAFRVIVDIASKALSPAINDPTTAVLAIDQIHRLLRRIGTRRLDSGFLRDASGEPRLIYRTPKWDDFVRLGVSEIRMYGAGSLQVARRLRAMLDQLKQMLPPKRIAPLDEELKMLDRAVHRCFPDPEDRLLAGVGDYQGIGSIALSDSGRTSLASQSGEGEVV